jgi:subtilisin family serine protease
MSRAESVSDPAGLTPSRLAADDPAVTAADVTGIWTDHIIVKVRAGVPASSVIGGSADARIAEMSTAWHIGGIHAAMDTPAENAERAAKFGIDRFFVVSVAAGTDTAALAARMRELSDLFELVETDPVGVLHVTPSDPAFQGQWALNNDSQSIRGIIGHNDADIDWLEAWSVPRPTAAIVVALLDTGLSFSHPDLAGQTVPGRCFVCGSGDPSNTDDSLSLSHGTLCAGIIAAATDNGIGISGVAPSAKVMPLKVTSGLLASQTYTGNALIWAADHGASIASMSWGFGATANVSFLRSAVEYADASGMVLVASTGNTPGALIGYPARWPEVIAVGASDSSDQLFTGTTTGPELDLVAPGVDIYTTVDQSDNVDGYTFATGTSMAAPMVAAAAAVIWGAKPEFTAADVRNVLEASVDDVGEPGIDPIFGRGRLNLNAALISAIGAPSCAGDYDGNGRVELGDLFTFLNDYFATINQTGPGLRADVNGSGTVNVEDIFVFMANWLTPC